MTNQELFDTVAKHLLQQGCRSVNWQNSSCKYRGSDGTKCAIGCLIPDDKYTPEFEGYGIPLEKPVAGLSHKGHAVLQAAGITPEQRELAAYLQQAHDTADHAPTFLVTVTGSLLHISSRFNLNTDVLR